MKNPYRQFLQLPLRYAIFATAGPLLVAKVVFFIYYLVAPQLLPLPSKSLLLMTIMAFIGVFDMLVVYYISAGWYDLEKRPWTLMPSPALNVLLGAGLLAFALIALLATRPFSSFLLAGAVISFMMLMLGGTQFVASLMLHRRVKAKNAAK